MPDGKRKCYLCGETCYGRLCRKCFEGGTKGNHTNKRRKTELRKANK